MNRRGKSSTTEILEALAPLAAEPPRTIVVAGELDCADCGAFTLGAATVACCCAPIALANLGRALSTAAALMKAFEMGGARRVFVSGQIDGWYDWDEPGPWFPGCGEAAP